MLSVDFKALKECMAKINISPIRGGYNLTQINTAIQFIVKHLNEKVLYRDSPNGEPNQMVTDLDLNGKRIYNAPAPVYETDLVRKKELDEVMGMISTLTARVQALEEARDV